MIYCNGKPGADVAAFVNECERAFESRLDAAVAEAIAVKDLKVIGLSGPSCSGKTTAARKLEKEFEAGGRNVHVVSIDNFYKSRDELIGIDGKIDFDSINAIDFEEFKECVSDISSGRTAKIPYFDFVAGKQTRVTEVTPDPADLFIFEGIQAVYPEITGLLRAFNSKSIYISVERGIDYGGKKFAPETVRLMRRIVRDNDFRGAAPDYTLTLWNSVRSNEEINILPYADGCDIRIDSTMPYEIGLLGGFITPLLEKSEFSAENAVTARNLLELVSGVEPISDSLLPDESIYFEFIK